MDTLRGQFGSFDDDTRDDDYGEDDIAREAPPSPVGQDERRMQVRAYNHWASLLQDRNFPSIEDLDPEALPDFGPYSVLLDFTGGIENPAIQYLGDELAEECGTDDQIRVLDDVPSRSLLSRITDHYMQILANQAPIGFEAEFINQRDATILYRGILLPFSSDDDTIDFIYGVINWKEMADQITTDELMLEVDQALEEVANYGDEDVARDPDPVTDWADGPTAEVVETEDVAAVDPSDEDVPAPGYAETASSDEEPLELTDEAELVEMEDDEALEVSVDDNQFASLMGDTSGDDEWDEDDEPVAEFVLPDIGDADEEETIDHGAFASLAPAGEDEDEEEGMSIGLASMRSKPAKKPLDLSLASALEPMTDGSDEVEVEDDLPMPAFGQEDDRFVNLMGADLSEENSEDEGSADDWSSPLELDTPVEEAVEDVVAEPVVELSDEPVEAPVEPEVAEAEEFEDVAPVVEPVEEEDVAEVEAVAEEPATVADLEPVVEEATTEIILPSFDQDESEMGLYDVLADARELAVAAQSSEDRSRAALYDAVGRAYDVSIVAQDEPEDFAELIEENGLTMQDRAPMTPVVKLVFGADYDKTRLTEYAAVLTHAHRLGLDRGGLSKYLAKADGGLKGVVQAERRLRREEEGKSVDPVGAVRSALAKKLRKLKPKGFNDLADDGAEFGVVMIRRTEDGDIVVLGEVSDDIPLVEKVARKLVG